MRYLMFNQEFECAIKNGLKTQTFRPWKASLEKRFPEKSPVSLRVWSGVPYQSKQRTIKNTKIIYVHECTVYESGLYDPKTSSLLTDTERLNQIAFRDGFTEWARLTCWLARNFKLPFDAGVIRWA